MDRFGHDALESMLDKIVQTFGSGILLKDGSIDRKILGSIVFSSKKKLLLLESIIHPVMVTRCRNEIQNN
ncbi:MAG: dephospho-CoA kinase, partial [Bacteroidetes bacterium]